MRIFGRKKAEREERWSSWPETLDVEDGADVRWIQQSGDPLVWHTAALACLIFRGDRHGLLAWLVQQPTLDRVTAAAMFLHRGNGVRRLRQEHLEFVHLEEAQVAEMIDALCDLDATRVLPDHGVGMEPGWEIERAETVAALAGVPSAPMNILGRPIDRQKAAMPYSDIGEGDLVSEKFMRTTMPFLYR